MSKISNTSDSQELSIQIELDLRVVASKDVGGLEMGVLNDGTPFLTGQGLARACNISNGTLDRWGELTPKAGDRFRRGKMAELLSGQRFEGDRFFVRVSYGQESVANAYSDAVCMAFLEYYAFEAGKRCTETAKNNYRKLGRKSLRDFIYELTEYDPLSNSLSSWRHFHDRLLLNPLPKGYFSVFKETASMVLASIEAGLLIDEYTVPDISVGLVWSSHWKKSNLEVEFGRRVKYPHTYPDYFSQSKANGSIDAYIYPNAALGAFRDWLESEYLPTKYPAYLNKKVKQGLLPPTRIISLVKALEPIQLKQLGQSA
jgi:hypothetical protein